MNSPVIVQKSFSASSSSRMESSWCGVEECNSSDLLWRISCSSPRSGRSRVDKADNLRRCSHPKILDCSICELGLWSFHFFAALALSLYWAFGRGVLMRPSPPILKCLRPQCLRPYCLLSRYLPRIMHNRGNDPGKTFGPNWCSPDWSFEKIGDIRPLLQTVLLVR